MNNPQLHPTTAAEAALQLPLDFYPTAASEPRLEVHAFELSWPETRGDRLSAEAALSAAFGVLLARYSGQGAIPLSASRWALSGPLPSRALCLSTPGEATFGAVLSQAAEQLGHHEASAALGARAGRDRGSPGGQAAITWVERGRWAEAIDALRRSSAGQADLRLVVEAQAGDERRLRAAFVYDERLFRPASVERFAGHLGELLGHAIASLDAPIARLPMLPASERQWLDSVCRGGPARGAGELVHRRLEAWARETPEARAVRHRGESLSYAELNRRANRLARLLRERGAGPDERVVVCLEPSLDIAVALLAILKAGAVYVPLDPTYPPARIRAILDDTKPKVVLTKSHLVERLSLGGEPLLSLGEAGPDLERQAEADLDLAVDPSQTAYVYYTSGTTGRPKGVMASHDNLRAYVQMARDRYGIDQRDVMPAIARFSFSISMFELMSPLAAGGTLVVLDREVVLDPARLSKALAEVTIFHAGPSLLKGLLAHIRKESGGDFGAYRGVRHASSGGDMVPPEVLEGLKEVFTEAEVFVIYGCSEISCMGCTYPAPRDRRVARTYVGRPFEGTTVRVLDGALGQVPAGVVGEVYFSGPGVVKGYLNRPELTEERFVEVGGERFYRTGDVGRLSEDGWLELLGRSDFQVKLRGMRVELGEVEHCLRRAPGVRDGVVSARDAADGEKVLVAYVVPDGITSAEDRAGAAAGGAAARAAAIRRHMVDHLPDYMVPATYVELESLPLNHNMKVDRRALPEPEKAAERAASPGRPPETETEQALAGCWQKALGVERVSLDDNFFDLGGQSILAMQLIRDVERALGAKLDGMDVLRETLEVQAALCDRQLGRASRAKASKAPSAAERVEVFHFGKGGDLYGALYGAPGGRGEAALICSPPGHEHVRANYVLTRLARQLAQKGVPTLRFDFFGFRDSLGETVEASCERWQSDIVEAFAELKRRTGAGRVTAVGVRLGATLLWGALGQIDPSRLVLWDPVVDGREHLDELLEAHRRYLRGLRHLRFGKLRARARGGTEILGSTYRDETLRELARLSMKGAPAGNHLPIKWLSTERPERARSSFAGLGAGAGSRLEALSAESGWGDVNHLEDMLPDVGIAGALAAMATEDR